MTAKDVHIGDIFIVKVSGKLAPVRITLEGQTSKGRPCWEGINIRTNRKVYIRSARKLRRRYDATTAKTHHEAAPEAWPRLVTSEAGIATVFGPSKPNINQAMDDINQGGPDDPAQFSSDHD